MGSFEIFFIKSIHLQRFKFFRNMWSEVKLLHFNKVTFPLKSFSKEFILCRYSQGNFQLILEGLFSRKIQVVSFYNLNFQSIIIASYLTEPVDYWIKATKLSSIMIYYWKVLVKHLDEIAVGLVRLKRVSLI